MGCGSSRERRTITPFDKRFVAPHKGWNSTNGNYKSVVIKEYDRTNKITKGMQTEFLYNLEDIGCQTDGNIFIEDEWEVLMVAQERLDVKDSPDISDVHTQTEEDKLVTVEKYDEKVHVGIQVIQNFKSRATQTNINLDDQKSVMSTADFESQTDPVMRALAANAADSEASVLFADAPSPIAHIEKELNRLSARDNTVQRSFARFLQDIEDDFEEETEKKEVAVQTDNDPITDEAPEFAARPPPCKKKEMIPSMAVFEEIDKHALEAPESAKSSLLNLVNYLTANAKNDLIKVRALFRWISNNIAYDWKYMETKMSAEEVFEKREGVCKDYSKLFNEMCKLSNIRVKRLQGFAKGYDYRPGYKFQPGQDITHAWNAVYIFGAWRLIDITWGTGYTDFTGRFQKKLNEHFFLPDPEVLIWTHFPYDEMESDYSRWQLLDKPLTLDEFNSLPKVTPYFFEFNLRIRSNLQNPLTFRVQTEIKLGAQKPMRYKFKLYSAEDMENPALNNYVFCQMKEERLVGSFAVSPPLEGRYVFKIYARPELDMYDDATLRNVVIFLLDCVRSRRYIQPFPLNELPWGPTQAFYDFGMKLLNQSVPILVSWGSKRRLSIQMREPMVISHQILDSNGCEIDAPGILQKDETDKRIDFYFLPPRTGYYKFMIFALPRPKQKGKWKLPLVGTFLFDCKQTKHGHDDDIPVPSSKPPDSKTKMRIQPMR